MQGEAERRSEARLTVDVDAAVSGRTLHPETS